MVEIWAHSHLVCIEMRVCGTLHIRGSEASSNLCKAVCNLHIGSHEHHTVPNTAVHESTVPSTGVVVK